MRPMQTAKNNEAPTRRPLPPLAAVLAYRAAHYLMPLALALPAYAWSEWRPAARSGDAPRPPLDVSP